MLPWLPCSDWKISAADLTILKHAADGSDALLGEGAFGQVFNVPMSALLPPIPVSNKKPHCVLDSSVC